MCATGTQRRHLAVSCQLYKAWLSGLCCVTCACGAGSIWLSGEGIAVPSSWLTSWTEITASDMNVLRSLDCLTAWLPLPRSSERTPVQTAVQQYQLALMRLQLMHEGQDIQRRVALAALDYYDYMRELDKAGPDAIVMIVPTD